MKKAQTGGSAAILVLVIGAFILLYLLFLPPEDRQELLNDNGGSGGTAATKTITKTINANKEIVLDETPGLLLKTKQQHFEHRLPSFNLFTRMQDRVIKEVEAATVSTKSDSLRTKAISLVLPPKSSNVQLALNVEAHKGRLVIFLNGDEIFNGEVKGLFQPLRLENLKDENVLEFRAEDVGWQFWRSNFYELHSIRVAATVEDLTNQEARHTFLIDKDEKAGMKESSLIYFVDCQPSKVERLTVYINDRILSSGVPDCGSPVKLALDPRDLIAGKNELRFFAEKGSYLIDQVFVKTELGEPIFPIYFFDVNETQFELLQNRSLDAVLSMKLVNDRERKAAELNINNFRLFLDTTDAVFNRSIRTFIVPDSNFIRVIPETTFSIVQLKVELK